MTAAIQLIKSKVIIAGAATTVTFSSVAPEVCTVSGEVVFASSGHRVDTTWT